MHRDILPDKGSLGGIYTALSQASSESVLVLACDMPFVNPDLLRFMIKPSSTMRSISSPRASTAIPRPCTPSTG